MKTNFYVYEHWRTDRDECFYVGKGTGGRAYNMSKRNRYHKALVAKLIREGFAVEIRIVASGISSDAAFALEIERIAFWRNAKIDLTNMTDGGEGANNPTEETRQKMAQHKIGKKLDEKTRQKMSESRRKRPGIPHTKEARQKISEGKKNPSPETRRKMSEAKKGKPRNDDFRQKISMARKGRAHTDETRLKMSVSSKRQWAKRLNLAVINQPNKVTLKVME